MIVEIRHDRDHAFVPQPKRGCAHCGRGKGAIEHMGMPPSLNAMGDGNRFAYRAAKVTWERRLGELLAQTDLPHGLERVVVEGEMCFPDRRRRDQGNYRFIIEKALGDTLTAGGWLVDDDWSRYEFGNLTARYAKGECWTRLALFPALPATLEVAA